MVEHLQPRPRALPSPGPDLTAQPANLSPSSPSSSSSSSPSRATFTTPNHTHTDTLPNRHDAHSPRRSTDTPQESPEIDARPGRLKRRKPASRQSSPEYVRSTSPDHSTAQRSVRANEKQVRKASTQQISPSPSPPTQRKGSPTAADYAPLPSVGADLDAASIRSASPDRSDDEPLPLTDDIFQAPETCTASVVPAATQREIDAVISRLPPAGPQIEADANPNVEVDGRVHVDEGFCDESLESHYQAFMQATERLRMKRRPYYRVRTPGSHKTSTVVQRNVVQKTIRMRRREPKSPAVREQVAPASNSAVASPSSAT